MIGSNSRSVTGSGGRLRGLLVMGEVATAVLLLFGAGLLLRTLMAVDGFDRGYRAESVLSMLVDPLGSKYPTDELLQQFLHQVEGEVTAVPGVASVAWADSLPLDFFDAGGSTFEIVGDPAVEESLKPTTDTRSSARRISRRWICRSWPDARSIDATGRTAFPSASSTKPSRAFPGPLADRTARGVAAGRVAAGSAGKLARSSASRAR